MCIWSRYNDKTRRAILIKKISLFEQVKDARFLTGVNGIFYSLDACLKIKTGLTRQARIHFSREIKCVFFFNLINFNLWTINLLDLLRSCIFHTYTHKVFLYLFAILFWWRRWLNDDAHERQQPSHHITTHTYDDVSPVSYYFFLVWVFFVCLIVFVCVQKI